MKIIMLLRQKIDWIAFVFFMLFFVPPCPSTSMQHDDLKARPVDSLSVQTQTCNDTAYNSLLGRYFFVDSVEESSEHLFVIVQSLGSVPMAADESTDDGSILALYKIEKMSDKRLRFHVVRGSNLCDSIVIESSLYIDNLSNIIDKNDGIGMSTKHTPFTHVYIQHVNGKAKSSMCLLGIWERQHNWIDSIKCDAETQSIIQGVLSFRQYIERFCLNRPEGSH